MMSPWAKATLIFVGYLVFCYAFGISPAAIPEGILHGLQQMHQTSVNGGH